MAGTVTASSGDFEVSSCGRLGSFGSSPVAASNVAFSGCVTEGGDLAIKSSITASNKIKFSGCGSADKTLRLNGKMVGFSGISFEGPIFFGACFAKNLFAYRLGEDGETPVRYEDTGEIMGGPIAFWTTSETASD